LEANLVWLNRVLASVCISLGFGAAAFAATPVDGEVYASCAYDNSSGQIFTTVSKVLHGPTGSGSVSCPNTSGAPGGSVASASFSSALGQVKARASKNPTDLSYGGNFALSQSILLDVLTLTVAGADGSTVTSIPVQLTFVGGEKNDGVSNNLLGLDVGGDASIHNPCGIIGGCLADNDTAAAALPTPLGVIQEAHLETNLYAVYYKTPQVLSTTLVIRGPSATVPVFLGADAWPSSNFYQTALTQVTATYTVTLPAGVTCRSRSGRALGGLCPK
jgi:hypothetical protein